MYLRVDRAMVIRRGSRKFFQGGPTLTYNCGSAQIWKITIISFSVISAILSFANSGGGGSGPHRTPPLDPRMVMARQGIDSDTLEQCFILLAHHVTVILIIPSCHRTIGVSRRHHRTIGVSRRHHRTLVSCVCDNAQCDSNYPVSTWKVHVYDIFNFWEMLTCLIIK